MVSGQVQGVGFRWRTARLARLLDLSGSVRNRADGTVEIEASGAPEALDHLAGVLRTGMPGRVETVETASLPDAAATGEHRGFEIVG